MTKKRKRLKQLQEYRDMPNLEYGMYVEVEGDIHGYFIDTDGNYIYLRNAKSLKLPAHPTYETVYYDNPIDKNIIYDWRKK